MEQDSDCLSLVDFESRAFGFPFYRVKHFDERQLRAELAALGGTRPMAADSKVPADDVVTSHGLMRLGFRKVCMQTTLRHGLTGNSESRCPDAPIANRLDLDEESHWAHARNFTRDRFSLDPMLPASGRHQLYYQWLRNSLGGAKQVAHIGPNICTFLRTGDELRIDLLSILEKRRGIGSRLVTAVLEYGWQSGASSVRVVTECENTGAWNLYHRQGFLSVTYTSVFHLVLMP